MNDLPQLRDYQEEAVSAVFRMLRINNNVVLVLATGAGKTFCYAYITKTVSAKDKSVMIVAHRAELISQGSLSLARIGVPHQIIGPKSLERKIKQIHLQYLNKSFIDPFSKVSVGSVQTIGRRLESLKRPDLLVTDEAHHAPAGMWRKVIEHFNTKHLGLTATPVRSDSVSLGVIFDDMFIGKSMAELIEDGNLSRYIVYSTPEDIHLDEVKRIKSGESKGDYNTKDLEKQMDKPKIVGRAVEHYEKYAKGFSCLVFAVSVAHAEHIAAEFRAAGYNFLAISGGTDDIERYKAVDDLRNKRIDGIVNCDLFGEGTDISGVDCIIMMRPISESAFGLFSQQVGRGLRTAEGKTYAVILDMVGNFQRHGFPEDRTDWTLDSEDTKTKRGGANAIKIKTCPDCFHTHRLALACPSCGHVYAPEANREYEQVEGELVQLERQKELPQHVKERNAKLSHAHKMKGVEEKKQALERLGAALKYWKETCLHGDIWLHEELFEDLFGCTEQEARKYGATRANRLCDKMRTYVLALRERAGPEYKPREFDFLSLRDELNEVDNAN